ncbi:hypothetical protein DBB29_00840 [Pandoraea cepalis]|uniref:Type 4 secretion system PilS N-terminal domain-containing protein n=1 Tax=Pandoraea cepalis TaxID=2508294 RepID=A0AAW7MH44_9BURK|nr:type 4 pilus major pilin [Pandoraea cepalis]MDN4572029.1 hypothetical protein [Pandoraea cepalis]MDN4576680.1 hypothetical protein [Pandoraea cepalis]
MKPQATVKSNIDETVNKKLLACEKPRDARLRNRRQGGWGTIDTLIALFVTVAILIWVAARGGVLQSNTDATTESGNIDLLFNQIKSGKTALTGYGAVGTDLAQVLISARQVPSNLTISGNQFFNQWGAPYTITSTGLGFTFSQARVPQSACPKIVTTQAGTGHWTAFTVNGTALDLTTLSSATATAACNQTTNTLLFTSDT